MPYQIVSPQLIKRLIDNALIPVDTGNRDYLSYLAWLEEGNQPLPTPHPIIKDELDLDKAKAIAIDFVRSKAHEILLPTDWYVIRKMDSGTQIPESVTNYRQLVRLASGSKVASIEAKTDLSTLTEYLSSMEFFDWPIQ